ncbi:hypothetical protein SUGI_0693640 [Cryptomeria japonica]|uniref:putative UPF0481 protein At3g02645 n=1 Tax=Cryptomeria japonica TaxID=3369 RepID=UPI0024146EE1|nr:putative UPF0481 protein At3g02645 [Cryptomeria japonica]GLJ34489.1 hypothetical protein SUGI_0693640 [Cryptomeria japonica]
MKLENQIPLFILIELLQLEFGTRTLAIAQLAALLSTYKVFCGFPLSSSLPGNAELTLKKYIEKDPCHLLDLYRMMIKNLLSHSNLESASPVEQYSCNGPIHNINGKRRRYGRWINLKLPGWMQKLSFIDISSPDESYSTLCTKSPDDSRSTLTAELLNGAGIKFQPGKIGFEKRRFGSSLLSLPQIQVWDNTETLLRNLMAYEECRRCSWSPEETLISHYVHLFKDLIDSDKDVYLLRKSQVIWNFVGSDEDIVRMFNHLTDGITFHSIQEIEVVMKEAREHYNSLWNVWMKQFKKEHCSKPWYILSRVAATLVLGMTAVQCIYSVKK